MNKKILGLDLGSNSLGWALLEADKDGKPKAIIDLGVRIFIEAVKRQGMHPPKNAERRQKRLMRRVIQRRTRRKQKMLRYLVKLGLLPEALTDAPKPEEILNKLGDPYELRANALHKPLQPHELGRALLHLVQRRGFLSNKKTLLGREMLDDPDVQKVLEEMREDDLEQQNVDSPNLTEDEKKEQSDFKKSISELRQEISKNDCTTLGEYLNSFLKGECKRNRTQAKISLRTDRKMYEEELQKILEKQKKYHPTLNEEVQQQIKQIIFHQRPLKLKPNRLGKCSLEPNYYRCRKGRLEYQKFRYMQDVNHYISWQDEETDEKGYPNPEEREKLWQLFETDPKPTQKEIHKNLHLDRKQKLKPLPDDIKEFKGNLTACAIRKVLPEWDEYSEEKQYALVEDLITMQKKTALKKRLMKHWGFDLKTAVCLCMVELEHGHSDHSSKAVKNLLPHLRKGMIYSEARKAAGYIYETKEEKMKEPIADRLDPPPAVPNPIVQKGLYELRRVINAVIAQYGKPDIIRLEMARDLKKNTKRYKKGRDQQNRNTKLNRQADEAYKTTAFSNSDLISEETGKDYRRIKHRLWQEQGEQCIYSGKIINQTQLFSADTEIDHILPRFRSGDNSYMNKVVCFTKENRLKRDRTPKDAFSDEPEKWEQIKRRLKKLKWDKVKALRGKWERFHKTASDLKERGFAGSKLPDTRYLSRLAKEYLQPLGTKISFPRGAMTSWVCRYWSLHHLIGGDKSKNRNDHRHHAIDAAAIACIDQSFYNFLGKHAEELEKRNNQNSLKMGNLLKKLEEKIPWESFDSDLNNFLQNIVISHTPQTKISGKLHEELGAGFIEGRGTVYRKNLDPQFKPAQVHDILDPVIQKQVQKHLENHNNDPEKAFAEGVTVYHKDGKTPIRRVRILQAEIKDREKLEKIKFGIRDRQGESFRWMTYGNLHHIGIIRHKQKGTHKGIPVTMMEAAHRARGIKGAKGPIIQTDHGEEYEFVMALHINDLVRIQVNNENQIYRVQKIESVGNLTLRLHTAATLNNREEEVRKSISTLMDEYQMQKIKVNAIGKRLDDQENG